MDQFRPTLGIELKRVEQAIDMGGRLRSALRGEARRLVQDECGGILVDHHFAREGDLILAERRTLALWLGIGAHRFRRREAEDLAGGHAVARADARAIKA